MRVSSLLSLLWVLSGCHCDPEEGREPPGGQYDISVSPETQTITAGASATVTVKVTCSQSAQVTVFGAGEPVPVMCQADGSHAPLPVTLTPAQLPVGTQTFKFSAASAALRGDTVTATATVIVVAASNNPGIDVTLMGTGGTVTSAPGGISCPGTCSSDYPAHSSVVLTAAADETHRFSGWQGDAACATGSVYVEMARVRCTAVFVPRTGADWLAAGGPLNVSAANEVADIGGTSLVFGPSGKAIAAWVENRTVRVFERTATGWLALGGAPPSTSASGAPAVSHDGTSPLVAWTEDDGMGLRDVFVARLENGAWVRLGGGPVDLDPAQLASDPSLSLANVAWVETDGMGGSRIVVRRWSGTAWVNPAGAEVAQPGPGVALKQPRVARTTQGLAVAWGQGSAVKAAELMGTSTSWLPMGPDAFTGLQGNFTFDFGASYSEGWVLVATSQASGTFQVKRWRDGLWETLGSPRGNASAMFTTDVALSHAIPWGDPTLVWSSRSGSTEQLLVERFSGGSWARLGAALVPTNRQNTPGFSREVQIAEGPTPTLLEVSTGLVGSTNDFTVRAWELR
ncbi:MAG: hypothetical protein JNK82_17320 [Myxococcaceae bacterium]|nr:hypothetical protein [Myxococcaceae bacterium]